MALQIGLLQGHLLFTRHASTRLPPSQRCSKQLEECDGTPGLLLLLLLQVLPLGLQLLVAQAASLLLHATKAMPHSERHPLGKPFQHPLHDTATVLLLLLARVSALVR